MTIFYATGNSVEGRSLRLLSRDPIRTGRPTAHSTLKRAYPFWLSQNSEAEITQELSPKTAIHSPTSALNLGDMLRAGRISGITENPLGASQLVQATGNHRSNHVNTNGFGFAKIEIPVRNVLMMQNSPAAAQAQAPAPKK